MVFSKNTTLKIISIGFIIAGFLLGFIILTKSTTIAPVWVNGLIISMTMSLGMLIVYLRFSLWLLESSRPKRIFFLPIYLLLWNYISVALAHLICSLIVPVQEFNLMDMLPDFAESAPIFFIVNFILVLILYFYNKEHQAVPSVNANNTHGVQGISIVQGKYFVTRVIVWLLGCGGFLVLAITYFLAILYSRSPSSPESDFFAGTDITIMYLVGLIIFVINLPFSVFLLVKRNIISKLNLYYVIISLTINALLLFPWLIIVLYKLIVN